MKDFADLIVAYAKEKSDRSKMFININEIYHFVSNINGFQYFDLVCEALKMITEKQYDEELSS